MKKKKSEWHSWQNISGLSAYSAHFDYFTSPVTRQTVKNRLPNLFFKATLPFYLCVYIQFTIDFMAGKCLCNNRAFFPRKNSVDLLVHHTKPHASLKAILPWLIISWFTSILIRTKRKLNQLKPGVPRHIVESLNWLTKREVNMVKFVVCSQHAMHRDQHWVFNKKKA